MQTETPARTDHVRWWVDPEAMALVEPLVTAIMAPLAELGPDVRLVRSAVIRAALLHLDRHPATPAEAAAIQQHMARWATRDLALRTWNADDGEQARQQALAGALGLRTADLQALAVRLLAEHYGLPVPDWRTPPEAPDAPAG
jgi:hypothetical protein